MKAGVLSKTKKIQLHFPLTISPTPVGNVKVSSLTKRVRPLVEKPDFCPAPKSRKFLKGTLPEPPKPEHLPTTIQWLAGEGAGSWFHLEVHPLGISVRRYDPNGVLECYGIYRGDGQDYSDLTSFRVTHPSHCGIVTLKMNRKELTLSRIN
jgi:hypothetical protein